jgi:hypothetical protein
MRRNRQAIFGTLKPFIAGAFIALAGQKLFLGRRRLGPPTPDPFGIETGRGMPGAPPSGAAIAEGYEVEDANGRDLAVIIGIFAGVAGLVIGGTILALRLFGGTPAELNTFAPEQAHRTPPPAPQLQADPLADLARFQAQQNAAITGYAPLGHGLAHIPIARAMVLMQGKSLDPAPAQVAP